MLCYAEVLTLAMSHASPSEARLGEKFERLVQIMARLRSPEGCPWDRRQTFDTIKPYLLEETYEVLDAIDARDWRSLAEELGDLMLQVVFFAQMAAEEGLFTIADCLDAINDKLVRRHPHVFGDATARTAEEVKQRWDVIKAQENRARGAASLLDGVSRAQPALAEATQISRKVASVGFDWANVDEVLEKLREEVEELGCARQEGRAEKLEEEIGDILFVVANIARHLHVDPEQALRRTNAKFRERFAYVEQQLRERGKKLEEASLEEMEALWQEAKSR